MKVTNDKIVKRSLEVKLPTINKEKWKAEMGRVREKTIREERERARRSKVRVLEMLGNSQNIVFLSVFQWFVGREGGKIEK